MGATVPISIDLYLEEKGHKGNPEDGPAKEHSFFGRNQWNQSQLHMPKGIRAPIPTAERVEDAEPMETEEPIAQQDGRRGPVVMGCTEYEFLCDEMSYFRCEIADIRRED
jgi:hypothetical protein